MADTARSLRALVEGSMEPNEALYAVVDAARDWRLALMPGDDLRVESVSLLGGELAPFLRHVAPHLVTIDLGSEYLEAWEARLGGSAGILLLADAPPDELRRHLRSIFEATDEEGEAYFFRFYDPRVLRPFLDTCTAGEADELFGPVSTILVEAAQRGLVLQCQPAETGVTVSWLALGAGVPVPVIGDAEP